MRRRIALLGTCLVGVLVVCVGCFWSRVPPVAQISVEKLDAAEFRFSGADSTDADGLVVRFRWDFGDGESGLGVNVTHVFAEPGEYVVRVFVTDDDGLTVEGTTTVVAGRTLRVPGEFATIAEATAAATLGDVVLLAEGTFREYVDFAGKAITIRGESQTGTTLMRPPIDSGQFPGSTVRFENGEGPDSILENLTLQGDEWHMFDGGAIKIVNASPTIRGCVLSSNRAQFGGAVYAVDSGAQFVGNRFLSNRAVIDGGAVCAVGTTAFPDFYDNEFTGNFANAGGAIRLQAGGTWLDDNAKLARLSGNAFTRNEAVGARAAIGLVGGAIHVGIGVRAILEDNTFIGNEPTDVFHEDAEL